MSEPFGRAPHLHQMRRRLFVRFYLMRGNSACSPESRSSWQEGPCLNILETGAALAVVEFACSSHSWWSRLISFESKGVNESMGQ